MINEDDMKRALNWLRKEKNYRISHESTDYIDLLKEAGEKQVAKKPVFYNKSFATHYTCPVCGRLFWEKEYIGNFCDSCGQKLEVNNE